MDLADLGRYRLQSSLAVGGMGEIYLARASGPGGVERKVAIKVVRQLHQQNVEVRQLFVEEAKVSFLLIHPNIVQTYEIGEVDQQYFLVLEYVEGIDLALLNRFFRDRLRQPLPLALALHVGAQLARGLDHAHTLCDAEGQPLQIVHRDISPTNVLLSVDGQVKIADFGLAKSVLRVVETDSGVVRGKLAYMAPEQVRALPADHRCDLYALGVMLYELLAGRHPFGLPAEISYQRRLEPQQVTPLCEVVPGCPPAVSELVARCLAEEPEQRLGSARELGRGIDRCVREQALSGADYELAEVVREALAGRRSSAVHPFDRALGIELRRVGGASTAAGLSTFAASSPFPETQPPLTLSPVGSAQAASTGAGGVATATAVRTLRSRSLLVVIVLLLLSALVGGAAWLLLGTAEQVVGMVSDDAGRARLRSGGHHGERPAADSSARAASTVLGDARVARGAGRSATLRVEPRPGGGRVWVNGSARGTAPLSLSGLPAGRVGVEIVTPGRQTYREEVLLEAGAVLTLRPELAVRARAATGGRRAARGTGTLSVNSEPWSIVYVDGKRVRGTPLRGHELPAGRHVVRLVNPTRQLSATRVVTVRPDEEVRLIVELTGPERTEKGGREP